MARKLCIVQTSEYDPLQLQYISHEAPGQQARDNNHAAAAFHITRFNCQLGQLLVYFALVDNGRCFEAIAASRKPTGADAKPS